MGDLIFRNSDIASYVPSPQAPYFKALPVAAKRQCQKSGNGFPRNTGKAATALPLSALRAKQLQAQKKRPMGLLFRCCDVPAI
ncbi:hypothetical protein [Pseudomonas sp. Au-Pse12]|uniref:hypothetical protein n=1 Tax=Pseudomonas sp. Au-Pse12 TaxID=2906459 RepID=UPI001E64FDC4|nr:hypothetical protein [Pseudomonas sp. Au-Pse12]MCE4054206.1 hypothetical protein [Pseudomonas sp. Au-Pse12]